MRDYFSNSDRVNSLSFSASLFTAVLIMFILSGNNSASALVVSVGRLSEEDRWIKVAHNLLAVSCGLGCVATIIIRRIFI